MHQKDKTDNYAIDVQNLTKKFGDFKAVDNISFSVKRGIPWSIIQSAR